MQVRLPVVVIGGGLTAIDTATESLAYYPVQVEKFLARYEALVAERRARGAVEARVDATSETLIAEEFLAHARAIRAERAARGARGPRAARSSSCCTSWGGATIAYRRRLIDSPSYTLNHEEVEKALEEGIRFAEGLTPLRGRSRRARARAIGLHVSRAAQRRRRRVARRGATLLPARTILVAAGTQPNTVLAREDAGAFPPRRQVFPAARRGRQRRDAAARSRQAGAAAPC